MDSGARLASAQWPFKALLVSSGARPRIEDGLALRVALAQRRGDLAVAVDEVKLAASSGGGEAVDELFAPCEFTRADAEQVDDHRVMRGGGYLRGAGGRITVDQ